MNLFSVTQLNEVTTYQREPLGLLMWREGKLCKYVKVRHTGGTLAGSAGDPVAYRASTGFLDNEVTIRLAEADGVPVGAGLLLGSVPGAVNTTYYAWIQLTGVATLNVAPTGSPAAGNGLYLTTTDKTLARAVEGATSDPYRIVVAVFLGSNRVICRFTH